MSDAAIPKPPPQGPRVSSAGRCLTLGRIARRFRELAESGELGLVAYITAGDPTLEASEKIILAAAEAGADVIELGVPFSDPVADGPTIQRASERALRSGTTLAGVLDLARRLRARTEVPLVLFSYFNPILQMGLEKFAHAAAQAGTDGVLATDLTPEESADYRRDHARAGLDTIFLGAPTSTDARLARIAECSSGFVYLISRTALRAPATRSRRNCQPWCVASGDSPSCRLRSASAFLARSTCRLWLESPTLPWLARRWWPKWTGWRRQIPTRTQPPRRSPRESACSRAPRGPESVRASMREVVVPAC